MGMSYLIDPFNDICIVYQIYVKNKNSHFLSIEFIDFSFIFFYNRFSK